MIKNKECYVTTKEAAAQLGFTSDYIRRLILQGQIKAEKMGTYWLIRIKDLSHIKRQRAKKEG